MRITWNELTLNPDALDFAALLSDWRWLVPETMQPLVVNALGDLFLRDADDSMYWLDTGMGTLTRIAESPNEFREMMVQSIYANEWFMPQLIGDLVESGQILNDGQCYSWEVPPGLGGAISLDNIRPTDIRIHFSMFGQVFQQTADLPNGTTIKNVRIVDQTTNSP